MAVCRSIARNNAGEYYTRTGIIAKQNYKIIPERYEYRIILLQLYPKGYIVCIPSNCRGEC